MSPHRVRLRLFLISWLLFSAHFATNVVREHYPAFSLIEQGDLVLDEYQGFHADIFVHTDGHSYVGNQIAGSLPALVPLFLFDPLLDGVEAYSKRRLREAGNGVEARYDTDRGNRRAFFQRVRERGLDLRFGASTVATSVFLMAPLSALFVVFMYVILRRRGAASGRAVALALLFGFATPVFFRTGHLVHNMFLMMCVFTSFWLIWPKPEEVQPLAPSRIYLAGFLAGWGLALDYAGLILLLCLYGYLLWTRSASAGFARAFRESLRFVVASVPPVLFLLYTQWSMYGDPFLPGQYHMRAVNFTDRGWKGLDWPSPDLFLLNLFDGDWGLYAFGPLLLLGLIPTFFYRSQELILPRRERRATAALILAFMVFCAANQYSRMQWNTGFRYLLPLVPFIFLQLSDHLLRAPRWLLALCALPALAHGWVLAMVRYTRPDFGVGGPAVLENWRQLFAEGLQLPWLTVLRQTTPDLASLAHWWIWPYLVFALCAALSLLIWKLGPRPPATARVGAR